MSTKDKSIYYEKRIQDFSSRRITHGEKPLCCGPHLHYHIEILYIKKGKTTAYADSQRFDVGEGDIFVSFSNQVHRFSDFDPEQYVLLIVTPEFSPELTGLLTESLPESNLLKNADRFPTLVSLLYRIDGEINHPRENGNLVIRGALTSFFAELLRLMPLTRTRSSETRTLRTVVDFCSKNYNTALSLLTLEKELHISKYYISHLFGDRLGISFSDYINSIRVSHACRCLMQTDMSVTEIADFVGFNTSRTFNRAFIRHMGMPPSEYRKNHSYDGFSPSLPLPVSPQTETLSPEDLSGFEVETIQIQN